LERYYTAPYWVAGFPDKMFGLCTDEFSGLLENFPLEYSQKLFILWKNFFVVAAGLEVTATTEKHVILRIKWKKLIRGTLYIR
jgi:hypothetical protein